MMGHSLSSKLSFFYIESILTQWQGFSPPRCYIADQGAVERLLKSRCVYFKHFGSQKSFSGQSI